jgi:cytochrome c
MRTFAQIVSAAGLVAIGCSILIHPFGAPKNAAIPQRPVFTGAHTEQHAFDTLNKACINCHSNNTAWPWYSYVAPMSWLVERDVSRARGKMNLSLWEEYSDEEKIALLTEIGAALRRGIMPPSQYRMLHPEARLSEEQIEDVYQWTRSERRRLREAQPGK